jgi:chemotaxis protein methyltransferase CheR
VNALLSSKEKSKPMNVIQWKTVSADVPISEPLLTQFKELVIGSLGLDLRKAPRRDLERTVHKCARAFNFDEMGAFIRWLVLSPLTRDKIEALAIELTAGDTYFFRDKKTLEILTAYIFPELIQSRRGGDQHLKIWSAGCCTGEEAYSLAILLDQLIPDIHEWDISVVGTDVNVQFLQKAKEGLYGERSLGATPSWIRNPHFRRNENGHFEILPRIKKMVKFSFLNLLEDEYPSPLSDTNTVDLIFCREVLKHFAPFHLHQVTERLCRSLVNGGWLAISPGETSSALFSHCEAVGVPGVHLYQKKSKKRAQEFC